jgi:hypothetical protein
VLLKSAIVGAGRGVFAERPFRRGDLVTEYQVCI